MNWGRVPDREILEVFEIVQLGWTLTYATFGVRDGAGKIARRLPSVGRLRWGPGLPSRVEGEVLRIFLAGRPEGRCVWPNSLLDDQPLRAFDRNPRLA